MFIPRNKLELIRHNQAIKELAAAIVAEDYSEATKLIKDKPYLIDERISVSRGSKIHIKNEPIACAAARDIGKSNDFLKEYVKLGGALEGRSANGHTALALALKKINGQSTQEEFDGIQFLIDAGAKPANIRPYDATNNTFKDSIDHIPSNIFKQLIDAGLRLDGIEKQGRPFLTGICMSGMNEAKWFTENLECILNKYTHKNPTVAHIADHPLASALLIGRLDIAEKMVSKGMSADTLDENGRSLLFLQIPSDAMEWVIGSHPELIDQPDHHGIRPLINSTTRLMDSNSSNPPALWIETIKLLISNGADVDAIDNQGPRLSETPRIHMERAKSEDLQQFWKAFKTKEAAFKIIDEVMSFGSKNTLQIR